MPALVSVLEKKEGTHDEAVIQLTSRWVRKQLGLADDIEVASGLTMIPIAVPGRFVTGSPENEPGRDGSEQVKKRNISYAFEVGATEVTVKEFLEFDPDFGYAPEITPSLNCPINRTSMLDAMRFCRWLNERQPDFDADWTCYPPIAEIKLGMELPSDFHKRPGYRLPTKIEWEYTCRAGSRTVRFFGDSSVSLGEYCNGAYNSEGQVSPVASFRPNPFGLFDIFGNVGEWSHDLYKPTEYATGRGGDYRSIPKYIRAAFTSPTGVDHKVSVSGFRLVRVLLQSKAP